MKTSTFAYSNNRTIEQSNSFRSNESRFHRGSALLIVLGMLSFMVVSAVGFSIYMRQSRLPSSYLRRNVASRYLVKAALANAIEDLEGGFASRYELGLDSSDKPDTGYFYGIYDDPYPGCGPQSNEGMSEINDYSFTKNGDFWFKRVFCPLGFVPYPENDGEATDEPVETVPTMTLEALAYLPPAIADDVRRVSRLSRTAVWKALPYEAGRYAYTAVNVSDLFDVNRLMAANPRNSGPDRITLATLTSNDPADPSAIDAGRATQLDTALGIDNKGERSALTVAGNTVPFVSLADFAVYGAGSAYSPFSKFVGGTGDLLQDNPECANSLFVTDTWFPVTNAPGQVTYDLAGGHQPFKADAFGASPKARHFLEVLLQKNAQDEAGTIFEKNLGVGLACLYDYLDRDHRPISFCLPTTEAVPMVVGVSAPAGFATAVDKIGNPETGSWEVPGKVIVDGEEKQVTAKATRTCQKMGITKLTSKGSSLMVKILTAYPFKRMAQTKRNTGANFTVRGVMRVFLGPAGMKCRLQNASVIQPISDTKDGKPADGVADGIATFVSQESKISAFSSDISQSTAAIDDSVTLEFGNVTAALPAYWTVEEKLEDAPPGFQANDPTKMPRTTPFLSLGKLAGDATALRPLDDDGKVRGDWKADGNWQLDTPGEAGVQDMIASGMAPADTVKLRVQVALWIQVLENGKVVDMAPACFKDDQNFFSLMEEGDVPATCGTGVPILNFQTPTDITYANIGTALNQPSVTFTDWATLYAVDPRYNFAPENWYASTDAQADKTKWYDAVKNNYLGKDGRDRDIFMFTSDQEYLQDIGELQFLPYLQEMNGNGVFLSGDYGPNFHGNSFAARQNPATKADFTHGSYFWSTYTAFDNGNGTDPIYALPYSGRSVRFHSNFRGFKVNPYSDDFRVLSAALAGTPFDYYVASTNDDTSVNKILTTITLDNMMSTYSFGESALAKITPEQMDLIMGAVQDRFAGVAATGSSDWETAWRALLNGGWQTKTTTQIGDDNKEFLGATLDDPLHNVDRKFLASFWRECFDNRQQLFLVFVRAEPTAVGGGSSGAMTSAQLGGKAVALVWRDPTVPTNGGTRPARTSLNSRDNFRDMKRDHASHRTRVLFYHQFD